jgi:hypothetical protein
VKRALAVVAGVLALSPLAMSGSACELTLPGGDDGGEEGSTEATTGTQTLGDQCIAVFNELCKDAINLCNEGGFTLDQCIAANTPTCCTGSACAAKSNLSPADVSACTTAIDNEGCNAIATNTTPAECSAFVSDQ